jgi:hypothetical protein
VEVTTRLDIVTKKVLNESSGELEDVVFKQEIKRKRIRGGFMLTYKTYDDVVIDIIRSQLDLKTIVYIRDLFTKNRTENVLSKSDIADNMNISPQKATSIIKKMVEHKLLMRVSRGIYRLNPFMYVPFRAEGSELQEEWELLSKKQSKNHCENQG